MKHKKTILIISFILLLIVLAYFFTNYRIPISQSFVSSPETNIEYGYPGIKCIGYDRNGVCSVFVNSMANSTYTISVDD